MDPKWGFTSYKEILPIEFLWFFSIKLLDHKGAKIV